MKPPHGERITAFDFDFSFDVDVRRFAVALACSAASCTGASDSTQGTIDDVPVLTVREEVRIGSVDDPDVGFSRIMGVAVSQDGRVYVLEAQDKQVRVYDAEGDPLDVIGRDGDGPGEFRSPFSIGMKADTLWVADMRLGRFTLFTLDGEVIATFPAGVQTVRTSSGMFVTLFAGELRSDGLANFHRPIGVGLSGPADLDTMAAVPRVLFDRSGEMVRTAGSIPVFASMYQSGEIRRAAEVAGRRISSSTPAPSTTTVQLFVDDQILRIERPVAATAEGGSFVVTRTSETGDTIYNRTFDYRPRSFTEAFLDQFASGLTVIGDSTVTPDRGMARAVLDALGFRELAPPITTARMGEDGTVWLRREDEGAATFRWVILEPDGTPRGQLELPRDIAIHWTGGDVIWGALPDELDVPWLVKYRVTR